MVKEESIISKVNRFVIHHSAFSLACPLLLFSFGSYVADRFSMLVGVIMFAGGVVLFLFVSRITYFNECWKADSAESLRASATIQAEFAACRRAIAAGDAPRLMLVYIVALPFLILGSIVGPLAAIGYAFYVGWTQYQNSGLSLSLISEPALWMAISLILVSIPEILNVPLNFRSNTGSQR